MTASRSFRRSKRYRDFLEKEYLPAAREAIGGIGQPQRRCLLRSDRSDITARSPTAAKRGPRHRAAQTISSLDAEMKAIAERSFRHGDVPALPASARTDSATCSSSRHELIALLPGGAGARQGGASATGSACCRKPTSSSSRYPKFREKNGAQRVQPARRRRQPPGGVLHQRLPGRKEEPGRRGVDRRFTRPFPVITCRARSPWSARRFTRSAGTSATAATPKGWALYAERLADEMKLYLVRPRSPGHALVSGVPRGAPGGRLRAARAGLDAAAGDRLHAAPIPPRSQHDVASEVDRYIIYPGQATAYMLGKLEIEQGARPRRRRLWARVRHQGVPRSGARGRRRFR